jgi:hypothetical protein
MSAPRRQRQPCSALSRWGLLVAAALFLPASFPSIRAATTEQIVADRHSGLAINGFDPVAYFLDGTATLGKDAFEHAFAGVVWRFHNEGNRAVFIADPETYIPRFGGYDPVAVARGVAVPGDPRLWLMADERLYLFYSPEAQNSFTADPRRVLTTADRKWHAVQLTLSP